MFYAPHKKYDGYSFKREQKKSRIYFFRVCVCVCDTVWKSIKNNRKTFISSNLEVLGKYIAKGNNKGNACSHRFFNTPPHLLQVDCHDDPGKEA